MAGWDAERWSWRWGFYTASLVLALSVVVTGTIAKQNEWPLGYIATAVQYACWGILFGTFVYSCYQTVSNFILTCLYHIVCIAIIMAFFGSLKMTDPDNNYLWIPICVNLGVFMGVGVADACSLSWVTIRAALLKLLRWFGRLLLGTTDPQLPIYAAPNGWSGHTASGPPSLYSSSERSDGSTTLRSVDSFSAIADASPTSSSEHSSVRSHHADQPLEENPWASS